MVPGVYIRKEKNQMTRPEFRRWTSLLLGLIILVIVSSSIYGGFNDFLKYKRSVNPKLKISLPLIHFFTKEYLTRTYNRFYVEELPAESGIIDFYLYVDELDMESLNSDLPSSGKTQFKAGHIKVANTDFSSAVDFRYRGGLPMHWLYDKKSIRVKLPPYKTFKGERQFNLVNPSTLQTVTDHVSYDMSRKLGLLTPDYFPARLYINNQSNGLHYFLSKVDESFLRKNNRMPGSIYSGDTFYVANPFGTDDKGINNIVIREEDKPPHMWVDERLWQKDAARNAESEGSREDIKKYIEIINQNDPLKFMTSFENYFDVEKQFLYFGLDTITGTYHHDNFHNHKFYFDPYKGLFEPIEWDIRYWSSAFASKDLPIYPLLKRVKLNPIFELERDRVAFQLLNRFPPEEINKEIDNKHKLIVAELSADPFRQAPDNHWTRFTPDKVVPFNMDQYFNSIDGLKQSYNNRHRFLKRIYADSRISYTSKKIDERRLLISFLVDGNSPVIIDFDSIFKFDKNASIEIMRRKQAGIFAGKVMGPETLYPGRRIVQVNVLDRTDEWALLAFGNENIINAPLLYQYEVSSESKILSNPIDQITSVNAITFEQVTINKVAEFGDYEKSDSVHPWELRQKQTVSERNIIFAGDVLIKKDTIFEKYQTVTIKAGTRFKLDKGISLVFYGKVFADGTEENPIIFESFEKGIPWGSIVIQGKHANGSILKNINVSGGSVSSFRLVNYPGQLNIHDVGEFEISHCSISNNSIGDDAMHIAYSKGTISNCRFKNTAFDALDMDIVDVTVKDSSFENIGNDAIDLMNSNSRLINLSVINAGDKCISVGEDSQVQLTNSQLENCLIGLAVKDKSIAELSGVRFLGNRDNAISLYRKNARYSLGGTVSGRQLSGLTLSEISKDAWSTSHIDENSFLSSQESK